MAGPRGRGDRDVGRRARGRQAASVQGRAGRHPLRLDPRAAGPQRRGAGADHDRVRALRAARAAAAVGSARMLAIEGGPGYGTTDSRDSYLTLLAPLQARRDLLLVDLRGTGLSGALDCKTFRRTVKRYVARAGQCAAEIGPRRDFYGTGNAVDDVAAVLDALGIAQVDLYGDSYGTYAGQAFAARHRPGCARSCSTARTRCPAPTRRSATSPRPPSARCGSCASGGRRAPRIRSPCSRGSTSEFARGRSPPAGATPRASSFACGSTSTASPRSCSRATATCRCTAT